MVSKWISYARSNRSNLLEPLRMKPDPNTRLSNKVFLIFSASMLDSLSSWFFSAMRRKFISFEHNIHIHIHTYIHTYIYSTYKRFLPSLINLESTIRLTLSFAITFRHLDCSQTVRYFTFKYRFFRNLVLKYR